MVTTSSWSKVAVSCCTSYDLAQYISRNVSTPPSCGQSDLNPPFLTLLVVSCRLPNKASLPIRHLHSTRGRVRQRSRCAKETRTERESTLPLCAPTKPQRHTISFCILKYRHLQPEPSAFVFDRPLTGMRKICIVRLWLFVRVRLHVQGEGVAIVPVISQMVLPGSETSPGMSTARVVDVTPNSRSLAQAMDHIGFSLYIYIG